MMNNIKSEEKHLHIIDVLKCEINPDKDMTITENMSFVCNYCNSTNMSGNDLTAHEQKHTYENFILNIAQNKLICICCSKPNKNAVKVSDKIVLYSPLGQTEETLTFNAIIKDMFKISIEEYHDRAVICENCIKITVQAYTFKRNLQRSMTVLKNIVNTFIKNLENIKETSHIKNDQMYLYFDNCILENKEPDFGDKMTEHEDFNDCSECETHPIGTKHACRICKKLFKSRSTLRQHVCQNEESEKKQESSSCGDFYSAINIINQVKTHHHQMLTDPSIDTGISCSLDTRKKGKSADYLDKLSSSQQDNLNKGEDPLYSCSKCYSDFASRKKLKKHERDHPVGMKHICRTCKKLLKSKQSLQRHVIKVHVGKREKDQECSTCGKLYSKIGLTNHMKTHQCRKQIKSLVDVHIKTSCIQNDDGGRKGILCDLCGYLAGGEALLRRHKYKHGEKKKCPHCFKIVNIAAFAHHIKIHDNPSMKKKRKLKRHKCSKCDYSSFTLQSLEAHVNRYHLNVRPYRCQFCEKTFYGKITLYEHTLTHSGSKLYQCEHCGEKFSGKKGLSLHIRLHTGEKPYKCDLCTECFLSASRLQMHRIKKHFDKKVQCELCTKMFYTKSSMRMHVRHSHWGEPKNRGRKKKT